MSSQCYIMNMNRAASQNGSENMDSKPALPQEKVMSYEAKSVGSTSFFKCEACPYMAFAEDDIKFHLFTVHPELAKRNGLADNIQIPCPGCTSVFDAEETLRTHLRNHHKMGIKDVRKMVKSLIQIALKDAKLKKEISINDLPIQPQQDLPEVKIPQVIEIVPDIVNANNKHLPKGVAFISMDELNKMSMPNFEKVDPKEVIQEASINIVYTNDMSTQYVNVSNAATPNTTCNLIQMSSVPPDLISSIQPRISTIDKNLTSPPTKENEQVHISLKPERERLNTFSNRKEANRKVGETNEKTYTCLIGNCHVRFKEEINLSYHRRCHKDRDITCPECAEVFTTVEQLHIHLWKIHKIDLELPTCEVCGYKTFLRYRLRVHMKSHGTYRAYSCTVCPKKFKNANQLSKHTLYHRRNGPPVQCEICQKEFTNARQLRTHISTVHDKVKPFKCCECDYTAARKEELKLHIRSHTGDKPYACDQCEYRSGDHNALRRHKKKHSKDNVYKCKYCPYTAIQSTRYAAHIISKHPDISSDEVHCCPYCPFKSVSKDKYSVHLTTHRDKEGIKLLLEMTKGLKPNKPSWTIPSENSDKAEIREEVQSDSNEQNNEGTPKTVNTIPIEVFDCDSLPDIMPQEYPKNYCTSSDNTQQTNFIPEIVTDLSKDDNNSDCLISTDFNIQERHQYNTQHPLQMTYDSSQNNLHFLSPSVSMDQNLLQNSNVNTLTSNLSPVNNISNNIMSNFPIRLPPASISVRNNITLKPVNKISLPMTKVIGPIIKPLQILPIPSSRHSPIPISNEIVPRKKPKISVKSNLILKGPDQVNMFHSQQKMAFKRLEDNERFGLGVPVTFNNLITTQFMQLPPSESPNTIMAYPQDNMLGDAATTPVDNEINDNPQIFSFNQQMNVTSMTMLPPPQKIQTNDPSYIKLETTIKQNTQSPSLERMCNANLLNSQNISREYKASPPLEDIHKNMNEIKNEVKSDAFYTMALNNSTTNPPLIDQYMIDNIIPEQYPAHLDLSSVVLPEVSDQQNDVIEIDDNSDDNKLLPRFDMNFSLESLCLMHNDFHFLDNEIPSNSIPTELPVNEMNRMVAEVPLINQKEAVDIVPVETNDDCQIYIQGKKDPMMNTSVRPSTNKINVKNIELMKN